MTSAELIPVNFILSSNDLRSIQLLKLNNSIRTLLIKDNSTQRAAVALSVAFFNTNLMSLIIYLFYLFIGHDMRLNYVLVCSHPFNNTLNKGGPSSIEISGMAIHSCCLIKSYPQPYLVL